MNKTNQFLFNLIVSGINNNDSVEVKEPVIHKFKTQEEANEDGFYEATIRSNKKIYSWDEVYCEKNGD